MENHQPSGPKSGHGRLQQVVVYKRFQQLGFDWENFGFFDGRSLMGGGRTWRFDCSWRENLLQQFVAKPTSCSFASHLFTRVTGRPGGL